MENGNAIHLLFPDDGAQTVVRSGVIPGDAGLVERLWPMTEERAMLLEKSLRHPVRIRLAKPGEARRGNRRPLPIATGQETAAHRNHPGRTGHRCEIHLRSGHACFEFPQGNRPLRRQRFLCAARGLTLVQIGQCFPFSGLERPTVRRAEQQNCGSNHPDRPECAIDFHYSPLSA